MNGGEMHSLYLNNKEEENKVGILLQTLGLVQARSGVQSDLYQEWCFDCQNTTSGDWKRYHDEMKWNERRREKQTNQFVSILYCSKAISHLYTKVQRGYKDTTI